MQGSLAPGCIVAYPLTDTLYALAIVESIERERVNIKPLDESEIVSTHPSMLWKILDRAPW
jgi:hypothetical protein